MINKDKQESKNVRADDLLCFIESLPNSNKWIFFSDKKWHVTNEWLCGTFAGRAFPADTKEKAVMRLIDYLNRHVGHNSVVGQFVTDSGWPDLQKVRAYLDKIGRLGRII